jgi:hypothetical protein
VVRIERPDRHSLHLVFDRAGATALAAACEAAARGGRGAVAAVVPAKLSRAGGGTSNTTQTLLVAANEDDDRLWATPEGLLLETDSESLAFAATRFAAAAAQGWFAPPEWVEVALGEAGGAAVTLCARCEDGPAAG